MRKHLILIALAVAGCTAAPPAQLPSNHPASPDAAASPPPTLSNILTPTTMPATAPSQPQHGGHQHAH